MFAVQEIHAIKYQINAEWISINNSSLLFTNLLATPMIDIFATYRDIYITVKIDIFGTPDYVLNLYSTKDYGLSDTLTLQNWLEALNPQSLTLEQGTISQLKFKRIISKDIFKAGYDVRRINKNDPNNLTLNASDCPDLKISNPGVNMEDYFRYILTSTNGLLNFPIYDNGVVYLAGAAQALDKGSQNTGMVHNFRNVGELEYTKITPEMIIPVGDNYPLYTGFYLKVPKDFSMKTTWLVFGGYLVFQYNFVFHEQSNDGLHTTYYVRPERLNMLQRIADTRHKIDYSVLGIANADAYNTSIIDMAQVQSDAFITALLTSNYSFLVTINAVNLKTFQYSLEKNVYNKYISYQPFDTLALTHSGEVGEYWKFCEDGKVWSISFSPRKPSVYDFNTLEVIPNGHVSLDPIRIPLITDYNPIVLDIGIDALSYT